MRHEMMIDPLIQRAKEFMKESGCADAEFNGKIEMLPLKTRLLYGAVSQAVHRLSDAGREIEAGEERIARARQIDAQARKDIEEALSLADQ